MSAARLYPLSDWASGGAKHLSAPNDFAPGKARAVANTLRKYCQRNDIPHVVSMNQTADTVYIEALIGDGETPYLLNYRRQRTAMIRGLTLKLKRYYKGPELNAIYDAIQKAIPLSPPPPPKTKHG